jgi:hypothetical protein
MINTLNEIKNKVEYFCNQNYNIKDFDDDVSHPFKAEDHNFPLLYYAPLSTRIKNGVIIFVINIALMDLCYDKKDIVSTLSDLSITLTELKSYFNDDNEELYFSSLLTDTSFKSFKNEENNTVGWNGNIEFQVNFNMNKNRIVSND